MTSCVLAPWLEPDAVAIAWGTEIGMVLSAPAGELAANSVMHSASRFGGGGRFLVRVTALDGRHAAVTVTDPGGTLAPKPTAQDGESGRGLAVVRLLACPFGICDHDGVRTFTAVIAAPADLACVPGQPLPARNPAMTRSPAGARL